MIKAGGKEVTEELFAGLAKGGTGPDDMHNAGIWHSAVFTGVIAVITGGSGDVAVPGGTLLHKAKQPKFVGWQFFGGDVGDDLVDGVKVNGGLARVSVGAGSGVLEQATNGRLELPERAFKNIGGRPGVDVEMESGRNSSGVKVAMGKEKADGSEGGKEGGPFLASWFTKRRGDITEAIVNVGNISASIAGVIVSL